MRINSHTIAPQVNSTTPANLEAEDYRKQTPERPNWIGFNLMNKSEIPLYFAKNETLDGIVRIYKSAAGIDQNQKVRIFSGESMLFSDPEEYHEQKAKGVSTTLIMNISELPKSPNLFAVQEISIDYKEKSSERQQLMEFKTQPPISLYLSGEETLEDLGYIVKNELQINPTTDITILRYFSPLASNVGQFDALVALKKPVTLVRHVNELANESTHFYVRQSPVDYGEKSYDRPVGVWFKIKNNPNICLFFNGRETMTDVVNILKDRSKIAPDARVIMVLRGESVVSDQKDFDWQFAEGLRPKLVKNLIGCSDFGDLNFTVFER